MGPLVTHCPCRRLLLSRAPCCGGSALVRAFGTAAGPALCLSSAPRSLPLLRPPLSPASTRCPKKTASPSQGGEVPLESSDSHLWLGPVRTPHHAVPSLSRETFSDGAAHATLDPSDNSHFFHGVRQKYIVCGFHLPWACSHPSPTWQPSAL